MIIILINSIINCLDELTQTNIIIELKEFLLSIYTFLQKGNCLAHTNNENVSPLQKIFWLVEKEKKKHFPIPKSSWKICLSTKHSSMLKIIIIL